MMTAKEFKVMMFLMSICAVFFFFMGIYDALQKWWLLSVGCLLFAFMAAGFAIFDYKQLKKLKASTE